MMANLHSDYAEQYLHSLGISLEECRKGTNPTLKLLRRYPSSRVLDVGGGSGVLTAILASEGCQVTLLEISAQNIEYAKKVTSSLLDNNAYKRIRFEIGNLADSADDAVIERLGANYDIIVSRAVYEHLSPDQNHAMIENFARLLRPGGFAYIETMPTKHIANTFRWCRKKFLGVGGGLKELGFHINEQSYGTFKKSLARCTWASWSVIPVAYRGWLYDDAACNLPVKHPARLALPIVWLMSKTVDVLASLPWVRRYCSYGLAAVSRPVADNVGIDCASDNDAQ